MSEELEKKVQELSALVQKQNHVIANTGRQVMEMQVKDVKSKMAAMDDKPKIDTDDFVTNDDIVQLVGELQGQLDFLEDRSIKRVFNSYLTSDSAPHSKIAPLCNRDGDPAPGNFPTTLEALNNIKASDLLQLCEFYELIVENEPSQELRDIIKSDTLTPEDAEKLFALQGQEITLEERLALLTKGDEVELFDELARYIGVRVRRGSGW